MPMKPTDRPVTALILCAVASPTWANRPLNTETADIVEPGVFQWETYASRSTASGAPAETGWTSQLSYGAGHRTQLGGGYSQSRDGAESAAGIVLGGKTWLIELGDAQPGVTVAYGLIGIKAPGASWRHDGTYLTLVGSQPLGSSLLGHANLGWLRSSLTKQDTTNWALGFEYSTGAKVDVIAETFSSDRDKPTVSFGLRWSPLDKVSFNTSYGVSFENPRIRHWTLGLQLDF
jgi:hypothetical protein